ncbi:non-canonical purine NTP pyrophosphatase [Bacteroides thetaiotaomicron]|uniref:non-canonical purine NTP pyrophosphatase n=1 Tax=Bacteroides thetaiotaomicron TaxID=818 RepID=UPI0009BD1FB2|nr:non-canonical purine NTP pyrophosphatase [Bacteroides thetaiotaomicron]
MKRKLVFATNNAHKLEEVAAILGDKVELLSLNDIDCHTDIPETAETLEGNALLKSSFIYRNYQLDCFADGVACYPEKHEEAPNIESDLFWLKKKVEAGAEYAVTQLFYDNKKYFEFVEQAKAAGINVPIIPGIKPFKKLSQLSMVPKTFKVDLPEDLVKEVLKCKNDKEAEQVGIEWCVAQCKELMAHGVPSIHFYSIGAVDSIKEVAKIIY